MPDTHFVPPCLADTPMSAEVQQPRSRHMTIPLAPHSSDEHRQQADQPQADPALVNAFRWFFELRERCDTDQSLSDDEVEHLRDLGDAALESLATGTATSAAGALAQIGAFLVPILGKDGFIDDLFPRNSPYARAIRSAVAYFASAGHPAFEALNMADAAVPPAEPEADVSRQDAAGEVLSIYRHLPENGKARMLAHALEIIIQRLAPRPADPQNDPFADTVASFGDAGAEALALPAKPSVAMIEAGAAAGGITLESVGAIYAAMAEAFQQERAA